MSIKDKQKEQSKEKSLVRKVLKQTVQFKENKVLTYSV